MARPQAGTFDEGDGRKLIIKSDLKEKPFKYRNEVPASVLKSEFDYLDDDELDGFFHYHNNWYHISQFERAGSSLKGWHGMLAESFSTGVLLWTSSDGESYIVGAWRS